MIRLKLEELCGATKRDDGLIPATIMEDEVVQRKLDSQSEVFIAFKGMRCMGETKELDI